MVSISSTVRRALAPALGAGILAAGVLVPGIAAAAPANCTAADMAGVAGGVAMSTKSYLLAHPDVNAFYTGIHGKSRAEATSAMTAYFQQHPQVLADMKQIRQPIFDFRDRCGLPQPNTAAAAGA